MEEGPKKVAPKGLLEGVNTRLNALVAPTPGCPGVLSIHVVDYPAVRNAGTSGRFLTPPRVAAGQPPSAACSSKQAPLPGPRPTRHLGGERLNPPANLVPGPTLVVAQLERRAGDLSAHSETVAVGLRAVCLLPETERLCYSARGRR